MILLSNDQTPSNKAKVIGLKPVSFPKVGEEDEERATDLEIIEQEIKEAQNALNETKKEADRLLTETNNQILKQKSDWEEEKIALMEEAQKEGFQAGFQSGEESAIQQYEEKINKAKSIVESAELKKQQIIEQSEPAILELAVSIASKIISKQLDTTDDFIHIVKKGLEEVRDQSHIKIFVHPDHLELLQQNELKLTSLLDNNVTLSLYPDAKLTEGGCVIETPFSKLDVSVDSQLNVVSEHLFELMEEMNREY